MWRKFIVEHKKEDGKLYGRVDLRPDHVAFDGHFPGHPLLPAVFHMIIIKEMAEIEVGVPLRLVSILRSKFTQKIIPGQDVTAIIRKIEKSGTSYIADAEITISGKKGTTATLEFCPTS